MLKNNYADRLKCIGLTDLETRRNRGDLIQVYKLLNGQKLQRDQFPAANKNNFGSGVTSRHNFFTNRVVPLWNSLPDEVIRAPILNSIKAKLDKFVSKPRVLSGDALHLICHHCMSH